MSKHMEGGWSGYLEAVMAILLIPLALVALTMFLPTLLVQRLFQKEGR